jgi:O-antigen ligase
MTSTEKNLKFLIYLGVAVLLLIPFIVTDSLFFPFVTGKAYTFRVVAEIIIAIYLILAVLYPIYRPKNNWIFITFLLFVISLFYSNLMGVNPTASFWSNFERMEGWITIVHLFGLFIALGSILREKKDWIWIFNTSIVLSLFMVFSAFGQVLESGFNTRVDTTLGNSTYLGIYMLMNAFLSLFMLLRQKISFSSWQSWFYIISFVLQSIIVFQTGTRGSMLGLLGGILLTAILITFLNKEQKFFRKVSLILISAVIIFVGSIFVFKDTNLIQNISPLKRITTININEGTAQARINNWQMATEGFKERPVFGWGQSNFNYVFDKHYLPKHHGNETWFDRVHNILFDWLIAGGIFGLLLYISILLSAIYYLFKAGKLEPNEKAVMIGLLAGYFVHNFFVFDQIVSYIYFALLLSFIYSQSDSEELEMFKNEVSDYFKKFSIGAVLFATPFVIYLVNYPSYAANKELLAGIQVARPSSNGQVVLVQENGVQGNIDKFKSALNRETFANSEIIERAMVNVSNILKIQNLDNNIKQDYVNFVVEEMDKHIQEFPNNSRYHYIYGTFFARIGQNQLAEEQLLRAIEISPKKQVIRIPLLRVYTRTQQQEKATQLAKETYELDTSKDELWVEYVRTLANFEDELSNQLINEAIEKQQNDRVLKLLESNISNNPDNIQNYISLAAFYMRIDEKEETLNILSQTLVQFPKAQKQINELITQIESGERPLGETF